jgi:hypothetical protein
MPKKIVHTGGQIEIVYDDNEKTDLKELKKIKNKGKRKLNDLSQDEINRLVVILARQADLI